MSSAQVWWPVVLCCVLTVSGGGGMSSAQIWWPVVLCCVLTVSGGLARLTEEEVQSVPAQDTLGLLAPLQQSEGSSSELRRMANMYELLQLAALQQQQQRHRLLELEDREEGEGGELPMAYPLQPRLGKEEYLKEKRGSYMSLCHFKICNMGRKRSSYWNTWGRN